MFNFVYNDALSFYINKFLKNDCAVHSTGSVSSFKVQPILRNRDVVSGLVGRQNQNNRC